MVNNRITRDFLWSGLFLLSMYGVTHNPIVRPTPQPVPGNWSIQFMQHPLLFGLAGHNYIVIRNQDGEILSELHGLATDTATGRWKYIGTSPTDLLKIWEFDSARYYLAEKKFPGVVLAQGSKEDVELRWKSAHDCMTKINEKTIPYPPYGFMLRQETENSNSAAYTLGICMGLDIKHLGLFTPGSRMNLLGEDK